MKNTKLMKSIVTLGVMACRSTHEKPALSRFSLAS